MLVGVTSLFTTKGQAFEDRSLYRLMFSFLLNRDNYKPPEIQYKGFVFVEHFAEGTDVRRAVDQAWQDAHEAVAIG